MDAMIKSLFEIYKGPVLFQTTSANFCDNDLVKFELKILFGLMKILSNTLVLTERWEAWQCSSKILCHSNHFWIFDGACNSCQWKKTRTILEKIYEIGTHVLSLVSPLDVPLWITGQKVHWLPQNFNLYPFGTIIQEPFSSTKFQKIPQGAVELQTQWIYCHWIPNSIYYLERILVPNITQNVNPANLPNAKQQPKNIRLGQ